jgi:pimeloyl-ACP methyl ester carboxylesterase
MPFYDAGDAAIYYEITGQGSPLILLHGYALNGLMWKFQIEEFSKNNSVIAVDLRGFGKSSCGREWSGAIMAGDVEGLIKWLGLRDVAILGFSMSGPGAVRVAYNLPDAVSRLILVSSILPSAGRPKAASESKHQQKELDILRLRGVEAWAEAIGMMKGPLVDNMFKRNPDIAPLWRELISRHNPDYLLCMMNGRLGTPSTVDWRSRLSELKQETLVIAGSQDIKFVDASHHLAQAIPRCRLALIKGAGHMVNLEAPEEFNRNVMGFLEMKGAGWE